MRKGGCIGHVKLGTVLFLLLRKGDILITLRLSVHLYMPLII